MNKMDKETFNMRRDWIKDNIEKYDRKLRWLKSDALKIQQMIEIAEDKKEMYRNELDELWEQYIG